LLTPLLQCARAVWPIFQKQKFGRIITTSSQVGVCMLCSLFLLKHFFTVSFQMEISVK
jgi:short-subunit dehydrogenase